MPSWTDKQEEAITKEGTNIIVSAGAGSGKTAVLTERVIRKLINGVDINHLLVLTFTNAAAAEMKDRIREGIKKASLFEQLDYIDASYITTFDSFAQSIVKRYHYLLNISPDINIIDNTVLNIETTKYIDEIFESYYGDNKFDNFILSFCDKDDKLLKKAILEINDKLELIPDKDSYINNYIENYYSSIYIDKLIKEYEKYIIEKKEELVNTLYNIQIEDDSKYYNSLYELVKELINSNNYNDIRKNIYKGKYPVCSGATDELKKYNKLFKEQMSSLDDLCHYSEDEIKDNLLITKDYVEVIINIVNKLDEKISTFKKENNSYTFTDIAKMAIKVVKDNKEVKEELKNYFNEIMIDEYQDTSDLQESFISLIANNNVYMVGDIKQSIYRFRNANPDIFRNKYNNYGINNGGYKIDLLENFRSRDEVLNNINEIFDYIMDEKIGNAKYRDSHRMIFGNLGFNKKANDQNYNLDILNYKIDETYKDYSKEEIEAFIIGNDIKNKIKNHYQILDNGNLRDITYDDIYIIMDRGSSFETYSKIFGYLSIPIIVWKDETLNGEDDIAVLKNIIGLIIKIKNNCFDQEFKYYFSSIYRSYLFNKHDDEIFKIFKDNSFKNTILYEIASSISDNLDSMSNNELLDNIIDKFNIYENSILVGNIEASNIRLNSLSNLFDSLSNLGYTPYDLLDYFKDSINEEIKYSLNTKVSGSVNLMNIHKSKGLGFNICYFSGLHKKFNESDIKNNFLFDTKYGIITPFYKEGIGDTILKELFKNKYNLEDISERIRLLYVGLTRTKEKMIMVTSLDDEEVKLNDVVDDYTRINYNSFLSIINSVKSKLVKYIKNVDLNTILLTKDYDLIKSYNYKNILDKNKEEIEHQDIKIDYEIIENAHYSKVSHKLHSKEEIANMEFGTYIHYLFEITDFKNPNIESKYKDLILSFINKLDLKDVKIYKEYEFIYNDNLEVKHGIIDLLLEYDDHINIYDYKLKNINDDNYTKQLKGYKDYIVNKTNKKVNLYLYSIEDKEIKEVY